MDTNITLSNNAQNVHILARLGDVDTLYNLAKDRSHDSRAKLSCIIGSILEADIPERESEMVADVLIKLMRQAEKDLRKTISRQISVIDNVPLRLVLQLANDDIEIAKPILSKSNVLSDFDLMYIIKSKTNEYWQAIAERESLNDQVIDMLSDTKDFDTALALADNQNIKLTEHALLILSDIAQNSDILATPLLRREEVSNDVAEKLYKYVGEGIKKFIHDKYNIDTTEISKTIDDTVNKFIEVKTTNPLIPNEQMIILARKLKEEGALDMATMLSSLRLGDVPVFIAQFSIFTNISIKTIIQNLSDPTGHGLAIMAKVSGIKKQDFITIFMLSSKIWNDGSLIEVREIREATACYNRYTPEHALMILKG